LLVNVSINSKINVAEAIPILLFMISFKGVEVV
jgi:hypothetical protein